MGHLQRNKDVSNDQKREVTLADTRGCASAPLSKSAASTRIYWTMSVRRDAASSTLLPSGPPASRVA